MTQAIANDLMKISTTSSQTETTDVSQSTVITVRLYGNDGAFPRTRSEPNATSGQIPNQETLITDVIVIVHPKSIFVLAVLELIIGVQMLVVGTICVIYNGPVYVSGVWSGWPMVIQGVLGIMIVKKYPLRRLIIIYFIWTILCFILASVLFGFTWHELRIQEQRMRSDGWDHLNQSTMQLNKIVESTKAAIFIVQMILLAAHATACLVSLILCILNVRQPSKELRRAFYIADDQFGHQLVLVPVRLRTGADIDSWLDEAAAAASSAALGNGTGTGTRSNPYLYNTLAHSIGQYPHLQRGLNGSSSSVVRSSKAAQTNVTFGR